MKYEFVPRHVRGLHLGPGTHYLGDYNHWAREFKAMDLAAVKILDDGSGSSLEFARVMRNNGIVPFVRIWRDRPNPGTLPSQHLATIQRYVDQGITRWFEVNNEPNLPDEWKVGEWRSGGRPRLVVNDWLADAKAVINVGGYPAFPALAQCAHHGECSSIRWYETAFGYMAQERKIEAVKVFQSGAWLAVHSAVLNHVQEIAGQWRFDYPYFRHPDRGVFQDDCSLIGFQVPVYLLWSLLGCVVPVASTEGGVFFNEGAQWDTNFPVMTEWHHELWTMKMMEMLEGYRSRYPWFFSMMPWLAADRLFGQPIDNWWKECWWRSDGRILSIVRACKQYYQPAVPKLPLEVVGLRLPESWTGEGEPEPIPEPLPEPPEPSPAPPSVPGAYPRYPRPPQDNGMGIHLGLGDRLVGAALDEDIARARALRFTWATVAFGFGEDLMLAAAKKLWAAGIMPVVRKVTNIQSGHAFGRDARMLVEEGIPAYVQIFNEPSDLREWATVKKQRNNYGKEGEVPTWCEWWIHGAKDVIVAGGHPGFQCLHASELQTLFSLLPADDPIWREMWFCSHNYGLNHPPAWEGDQWSVLGFEVFARMFQEYLGFVPPIICGEGGWLYKASNDPEYPVVDDALHARYHAEMFWWFASKMMSNGKPLPDYLFAVCPWILAGPSDEAWYGFSVREATIAQVKAIPPFVREEGSVPMPEPPPVLPSEPSQEVDFDGLSEEMRRALLIIPAPDSSREYWRVTGVEVQPDTDNMSAYAILPPGTNVEVKFSWPNGSYVSLPKADQYAPVGAREWAASFPMHNPWGSFSVAVVGNSERLAGFGLYGPNLEPKMTAHRPVLVRFKQAVPVVKPGEPSVVVPPIVIPVYDYSLLAGFEKRFKAQGLQYEDIRSLVQSWSNMSVVQQRPRGFRDIDTVILHHMGAARSTDDDKAIIEVITRHHRSKGWGTCGYHVCIGPQKVWITTGLRLESIHTGGFNRRSIGICMLDDLTKRDPTEMELRLLRQTLWVLWEFLGGNWNEFRFTHVLGHSHVHNTACPGRLTDKFTWSNAWGLDEVIVG